MSSFDKQYIVGIVGATGAVGMELIKCLHHRKFPLSSLRLFASSKSAGKSLDTPYGQLNVEEFSVEEARKCNFVFLAVTGEFSLKYAREIAEGDGPFVIDNSSAFRYHEDVPLVVPEINAHTLVGKKLIANPNCTTAIAAVALWPLHQEYTIRKMIVSTYQAASGAGAEGMEELLTGTKSYLDQQPVESKIFVHPLPFNLIPHIDSFQENGYTKEEMKVVWETIKIFNDERMRISCTAVRVPTLRAHAVAVTIQTEKPILAHYAQEHLQHCPGVRLVDQPTEHAYPMPLTASTAYDVEVGRIRQSLVFDEHGIDLFVCGDQLLRGAALNAVLIAEDILTL